LLSKIIINNIKVIRDLAVDLDPCTVFVGPNACGKSTVLRSIGYLCAMRDAPPQEIFVGPHALEYVRTSGADGPMTLGGRISDTQFRWQLDNPTDLGEEPIDSVLDFARFQIDSGDTEEWSDVLATDGRQLDFWSHALSAQGVDFDSAGIPTAMALHFEFDRLAAPAIMPVGQPSVAPDGTGLAAVLAHLALEHRSHFDSIKQAVVEVIPAIRDVRIRNVRVKRPITDFKRDLGQKKDEWGARGRYEDPDIDVPGHELIFDAANGAKGVPAHAMSDGTLRLLGLLTVALGPNPPSLLLLDNIERGMHPRALYEVVGLLRRAQEQNPKLQIVAATHSADLLDYVAAEQIRLLWLGDDGFTRCVRMTEHDKYDDWKALMTPSELWAEIDRAQHPPAIDRAQHPPAEEP
jgi:energy-coupling factor transporter ATP-binding protein EcfA2